MKAGTPCFESLDELRCPPVTGKFQAGRSILPALLCALKAAWLLPVPACAQDAGLWPQETVQKDRALLPAGEQKAKSLTLYLRASRTLREEGPEEALPLFREAMMLDPGDSTLAARTASLAASAGQPEEARRLLEETVKRHPNEEGPLFALTRFLIDHQEPDAQSHAAVLSFVRKATAKFPGSPGICRLAVRMHVGDQRRGEAQAAVRQTLARDSQDPGFWLAMTPVAREAFPLDDPDTRTEHTAIVTGCMEKAAALGAGDPSVLEEAGDFYARLPVQEKAVAFYQKVTVLQPGNLAVRRKLGQCLRLTGDMEGARQLFEELLQIDASDAVSHRAMISLLEAAGEAKEALKHRMELLRIDGGSAEEYLKLAALLKDAAMTEEHRLTLERGFFSNPRSARLASQLASAFHLAGRTAEATAQYDKAAALAAEFEPASLDDAFYLGRAECARDAGQRSEAAAGFRKAIDKMPKGKPERAVPAYCGLAMLWLEDGVKVEEARELVRLAAALKKDDPAVAEALGLYAAQKGDWAAALKEYLRAEKDSPHPTAAFVLRLATAFEHTGRKDEAIARLEKASTLPNASTALRSRLADLRGTAPAVTSPPP